MTPVEKHIACQRGHWATGLDDKALPLIKTVVLPQSALALMRAHRSCLPVLEHVPPAVLPASGAFLRLGGFSFKDVDAYHVLDNGRVTDMDDLRFLVSGGLPRRAVWALEVWPDDVAFPLEVLAWQRIPPQTEFRVFVTGGGVAGITQYHPAAKAEPADPERLRLGLTEFVIGVLPLLPRFDLALDLAVFRDGPRVIEINPLGPRTHLGLFTPEGLARAQGALLLA